MIKKNTLVLLTVFSFLFAKGESICYVPSWSTVGSSSDFLKLLDTMSYKSFSHVVYCFATPDGNGGLKDEINEEILEMITNRGHAAGAKVLLAFGGGASESFDPDNAFMDMVNNTDKTPLKQYIDTLLYFVKKYNLDGLDNDWEPYWETRPTRLKPYEALMERLRDSLPNKILMADTYLNPAGCSHLSKRSLEIMDRVNLMTYENNFGPDFTSSIETALSQWENYGVPLSKVTIILPFFGAQENTWAPHFLYKDLVASYPDAIAKGQDSVHIGGNPVWFMSVNQAKNLTRLAGKRCAGVGFWHVGLDAPGNHSLMKAISIVTDSIQAVSVHSTPGSTSAFSQISRQGNNLKCFILPGSSAKLTFFTIRGQVISEREMFGQSNDQDISFESLGVASQPIVVKMTTDTQSQQLLFMPITR